MVGINELHEHTLVQSMAEILLLPIGDGRGRELGLFIDSGIVVANGNALRRREAVGEETVLRINFPAQADREAKKAALA